jgi:hypothetical protein
MWRLYIFYRRIYKIETNKSQYIKYRTQKSVPTPAAKMSIHTLIAAATIAHDNIDVDIPPTPRAEESKYPRSLQEVAALDLSFLDDTWAADMLRDAMNAVVLSQEKPEIIQQKIDVWTYLSTYEPPRGEGFMFSRGDLVVESVQYNMQVGHSGCSMAITMRHLQLLAKIGFPQYREGYTKKQS